MAATLMPSPNGLEPAFPPFTDSPSSPAPFSAMSAAQRMSAPSDSLQPPQSPYPNFIEPSPVDSNGTASTDATEIEDDAQESQQTQDAVSPQPPDKAPSPLRTDSNLGKIDIDSATKARARADSDTGPQSVIHAPPNFKGLENRESPPRQVTETSSPTDKSETTVVRPGSPESPKQAVDKREPLTGALQTSLPQADEPDRTTPRAQTRDELEENWRGSVQSLGLENIPEAHDIERADDDEPDSEVDGASDAQAIAARFRRETEEQVATLKIALSECWTLCNTLAGLSSNHRTRIFNFSGRSEVQESAWRNCWKLCQNLYDSRNEDHSSHVLPTLEMCRDFCQALFEARQRNDETADLDSVLRVSFELNNHLYNAHDLDLPLAFQERTLDFYLTLCHRLMKQRTSLPEETDSLLRACWTLAEMLFSLRQNNREGKPADEELLGSAVQACWDLCDLFRDGWTQIRPDRNTPRATQTAFPHSQPIRSHNNSFSEHHSVSHNSSRAYHSTKSIPPETPTTIFDDTNDALEEDPNVPNILVLGPDQASTASHRWSSAASSHSGYSEASFRSSSTTTIAKEDANWNGIRVLLTKAAMNYGYQRPPSASSAASSSSVTHGMNTVPSFVKSMPSNSFGTQAWQTNLLDKFKKLVAADPVFRSPAKSASALSGRRMSAAEIARAVQWAMQTEQYVWLRDLFRMVFGCHPEDALGMHNVSVQA